MSTAARPESLDAAVKSVAARERWSQIRGLWERVTLLGAVVTVYGWENALGTADGELGREVVVQVPLVPGPRVAREKMGQQLASWNLTRSAQQGSAENWVREPDERSLPRLRSRVVRTVEREALLSIRPPPAPSWKFAGVSTYLVASSPRPPTCNTSHRRRGHMDYYWDPARKNCQR